ncbi:MAG: cellulase family glycosylhydrolase [Verrucomicrobiia bacterium]
MKIKLICSRFGTGVLLNLITVLSVIGQLPQLIFPEGVGVNIHFTRGNEKDIEMIAQAGFKFIRMDFSWGGTERKKGVYDFSAYDELTANLEKRGIRPVYILDYSNPLYEDIVEINEGGKIRKEVASPQKPESIEAFARWAAEAARHFKGHKIVWEIWNEPNIFFWKPKPDVQKYIALAKATVKAVKAADPQAIVIAPASSEFPWGFLEEMFKAGLIEELDAISVHPYRGRAPETVAADYAKLRKMIERYASPGKRSIPIISGEWGYATHTKGVSLETQAAYIVRQQLVNLMLGVPISIWYDWKNDGPDPNYNEHNFGTVTQDLKPKPAYTAIKTATSQLNGCRFVRRISNSDSEVYSLLFYDKDGAQKIAVWTINKPEDVTIKIGLSSPDDVKIVNWDGAAVQPELANGELKIRANYLSQYVTLFKKSRELSTAGAWEIERPLKTLVEAGGSELFQLPVVVKNPFEKPVEVNLTFKLSENIEKRVLKVPSGKSEKVVFKAAINRRDLETVAGAIEVEYRDLDNNGVSLGKWREDFDVAVSNLLKFDLAPVENGVKIIVQNPYKKAFSGTVSSGKWSAPLTVNEKNDFVEFVIPSQNKNDQSIVVTDRVNKIVAKLPQYRFISLNVSNIDAHLDGDSKVPAKVNIVKTFTNDNPFKDVWTVEYKFDSGWRFVRISENGRRVIQGKPKEFGLWVHGDNSGNILRMRLTDSNGQTFQPNGPAINWKGWRWVKFNLADLSSAGHWGGANDGIVRGDSRLDTLLIIDGSNRQTEGKIMLSGFTLIYEN